MIDIIINSVVTEEGVVMYITLVLPEGEGEFANKIKRADRLAIISLVHENRHQFGRGIHRDMSQ